MKAIAIFLVSCGLALCQTDSISRAAAVAAINAVPATATDPVLNALQQTTTASGSLYSFLLTAITSGQRIAFVGTICPASAQWRSTTPYNFGSDVTDAAGNTYQLSSVVAGTTVSGATTPTWVTSPIGAVTIDGGYTWTLVAQAGMQFLCTASAGVQVAPMATMAVK